MTYKVDDNHKPLVIDISEISTPFYLVDTYHGKVQKYCIVRKENSEYLTMMCVEVKNARKSKA